MVALINILWKFTCITPSSMRTQCFCLIPHMIEVPPDYRTTIDMMYKNNNVYWDANEYDTMYRERQSQEVALLVSSIYCSVVMMHYLTTFFESINCNETRDTICNVIGFLSGKRKCCPFDFRHLLHRTLSKWQPPVKPVIKFSWRWRYSRFSVYLASYCNGCAETFC